MSNLTTTYFGIPLNPALYPSLKDYIFEAFRRIDSSLKTVSDNAGSGGEGGGDSPSGVFVGVVSFTTSAFVQPSETAAPNSIPSLTGFGLSASYDPDTNSIVLPEDVTHYRISYAKLTAEDLSGNPLEDRVTPMMALGVQGFIVGSVVVEDFFTQAESYWPETPPQLLPTDNSPLPFLLMHQEVEAFVIRVEVQFEVFKF